MLRLYSLCVHSFEQQIEVVDNYTYDFDWWSGTKSYYEKLQPEEGSSWIISDTYIFHSDYN